MSSSQVTTAPRAVRGPHDAVRGQTLRVAVAPNGKPWRPCRRRSGGHTQRGGLRALPDHVTHMFRCICISTRTRTSAHANSHSLAHSPTHSLTLIHSLTHSRTRFNPLTLIHSYTHSLTHTLLPSHTHSLTRFNPHTLTHSYTHSRTRFNPHTLTHAHTFNPHTLRLPGPMRFGLHDRNSTRVTSPRQSLITS